MRADGGVTAIRLNGRPLPLDPVYARDVPLLAECTAPDRFVPGAENMLEIEVTTGVGAAALLVDGGVWLAAP